LGIPGTHWELGTAEDNRHRIRWLGTELAILRLAKQRLRQACSGNAKGQFWFPLGGVRVVWAFKPSRVGPLWKFPLFKKGPLGKGVDFTGKGILTTQFTRRLPLELILFPGQWLPFERKALFTGPNNLVTALHLARGWASKGLAYFGSHFPKRQGFTGTRETRKLQIFWGDTNFTGPPRKTL